MALYKLYKNPITNQVDQVRKDLGGGQVLQIPFSPDNTDYKNYQKWVAAGNTPEAAN